MRVRILAVILLCSSIAHTQTGWWHASLRRADGKAIPFVFEWKKVNGKDTWFIHNASESLRVPGITRKGDSILVEMPLFESQLKLVYSGKNLHGVWMKGTSSKSYQLEFTGSPGSSRFPSTSSKPPTIGGRWALFFSPGTSPDSSVLELKQTGNHITGTILNASGDYRYLDGIVTRDSLFLSTFDGGHCYLFTARVLNNKIINNGIYYSGAANVQDWIAERNPKAVVPMNSTAMYLKPGEERLDFKFNDLDGKPISIDDEQFKNKVVVIQLMGSWCPNCMDETAYLSEYYDHNKDRGVAIISLAYEYSTDLDRSLKTLRKFQQRFSVHYPMLITGVSINDSLRTEKTLPQLTPIKTFPSSIILDKKGRVRKLDNSFNGPATGEHYTEYKKEFEKTIDGLLKEN